MGSAYILRIQQPPAIRLVDTSAHRFDKSRSGTPAPRSNTPRASTPVASKFPTMLPEHDILSSLSLSSNPVISNPRPVFGLPSLNGSKPSTRAQKEPNEDEMDWTPTNPESSTPTFGKRPATSDSENWLRPQKFFAPEKPTGLEGLLESARIQDEPMPYIQLDGAQSSVLTNHLRKWGSLYILILALVASTLKWSSVF